MSNKSFSDKIDIVIYNFFNYSVGEEKFYNLVNSDYYNYSDLESRYLWLKKMDIDPNFIHLKENHKKIYDTFDKCNEMFGENDIEFYYTSGILSYFLVGEDLQRYHHDLDIFVNLNDLERLEQVCGNYGFTFKRQLGDRNDGTKRVMLKMYYEKSLDIPITLFMYLKQNDGSIEQNDYYIDDNNFYVEKMYNTPIVSNLSFSNEPKYHNNFKYFSITLEALYLSKVGNRPKDIYDCSIFEDCLDKDKLELLKTEICNNKQDEVFSAQNDPYYNFIFSEFKAGPKVLLK